jgi:hypothetical protein
MAFELVAEVLDHAPEQLDPAERLVLLCIAEECRGNARIRDIPAERIRRRTGLGERGLRHVCERLAAKGLKVRVALSIDRHGKPVYALTGKVCRWILPELPIPDKCDCARCEGADAQVPRQTGEDSEGRTPDAQGRTPDGEGMPAGPVGPPKPSIPFPSAADVDQVREYARTVAATAAAKSAIARGVPRAPEFWHISTTVDSRAG